MATRHMTCGELGKRYLAHLFLKWRQDAGLEEIDPADKSREGDLDQQLDQFHQFVLQGEW